MDREGDWQMATIRGVERWGGGIGRFWQQLTVCCHGEAPEREGDLNARRGVKQNVLSIKQRTGASLKITPYHTWMESSTFCQNKKLLIQC